MFGESTGRGARDAVCAWSASHRKLLFCVSFWSHHAMPLPDWQLRAALRGAPRPLPPPCVCIGCLVGFHFHSLPSQPGGWFVPKQGNVISDLVAQTYRAPTQTPHTSHTRIAATPSRPRLPHAMLKSLSSRQSPFHSSLPPPPSTTQAAGANICPLCPSFPHCNALHPFSRMPHRTKKQSVLSALAPGAPKKPPPTLETLLAHPPLRQPTYPRTIMAPFPTLQRLSSFPECSKQGSLWKKATRRHVFCTLLPLGPDAHPPHHTHVHWGLIRSIDHVKSRLRVSLVTLTTHARCLVSCSSRWYAWHLSNHHVCVAKMTSRSRARSAWAGWGLISLSKT